VPCVRANGISIYCEQRGAGSPILLIHGGCSDATFWGSAVDELAAFGRVILYDRRGCSRTQVPDHYRSTSPGEQAADAAGLLEVLDAAPAVVIGRSLGGVVALELARAHPQLVRGLVLLESAPSGLSRDADAAMETLAARIRNAAELQGVEAVAETLIRAVLHDKGWEDLPGAARHRLTANGGTLLVELDMPQPEIPDPTVLHDIAQPVLVVGGLESPPMFEELNRALVRWLPHARLVHVQGGHRVSPAEPEVVKFVREVLRDEQHEPLAGHIGANLP
jgi:esterase